MWKGDEVSVPSRDDGESGIAKLIASPSGGVLIAGWTSAERLESLAVLIEQAEVVIEGGRLARFPHPPRDGQIGGMQNRSGFVALHLFDGRIFDARSAQATLRLTNGRIVKVRGVVEHVTDLALQHAALAALFTFDGLDAGVIAASELLDAGWGEIILQLGRLAAAEPDRDPVVVAFGRPAHRPKTSIVIPLVRPAPNLFVQNALFSQCEGIEDYETLYVLDAPEIANAVADDMKQGLEIYGLAQKLIVVPRQGYAAAINRAAEAAQSDRLILLQPDVYPRDDGWAQRHNLLTRGDPRGAKLFGASLHQRDGTPEPTGVHIHRRTTARFRDGRGDARRTLRAEATIVGEQPVTALTSAFLSIDRNWFEALGGLDENYLSGDPAVADLCLRSLYRGSPSWLHDLKMWRADAVAARPEPSVGGASVVSRWIFDAIWAETIDPCVLGGDPKHPALARNARD